MKLIGRIFLNVISYVIVVVGVSWYLTASLFELLFPVHHETNPMDTERFL